MNVKGLSQKGWPFFVLGAGGVVVGLSEEVKRWTDALVDCHCSSRIVCEIDKIVGDADQTVFDFDLLPSSQQKPSEVSVVFDLGKDGLWFSHPPTPQLDA